MNLNDALNPDPTEAVMAERVCLCGCGTAMNPDNKWVYARGHKPGGKKAKGDKAVRKPKDAPAEESEEVVDIPHVAMELNESQLNRIWEFLPLEDKAYAIAYGLTADRE